jgi:hypothetical protein
MPATGAVPQAAGPATSAPDDSSVDAYRPGACNIGAWEIRRRRRFAIVAFVIAAVLLAVIVAAGAPPAARLLVLLPLWGAAFSWLQARRRFCAGFAVAGIVNFADDEGGRSAVTDPAARREDLRAVRRMTRDAFLIAAALTLVALAVLSVLAPG